VSDPKVEADLELRQLIRRWTDHMQWRSDLNEWRERRFHQEEHQEGRILDLENMFGGLSNRKILECGCGMGGLAVALSWRGAQATALDFNHDYCRITQLRGIKNGLALPVVNGAGEALPFKDGSFELATCLDVLEHVRQAPEVIQELARVLRPGGVAVATATNRLAFRDPHYHIRGINWLPRPLAEIVIGRIGRSKAFSQFKDRQTLSEMHYFTYRSLRKACKLAGFQVLDARQYRLYCRLRPRAATDVTGIARAVLLAPLVSVGYAAYRLLVMGTLEVRLVRKP
jgi:ubiquinone/menaquinone biosynthesis C-methylase UbiE